MKYCMERFIINIHKYPVLNLFFMLTVKILRELKFISDVFNVIGNLCWLKFCIEMHRYFTQ
jgi:hypothetical protein